MIHPRTPPSVLRRGADHFIEGHIMKAVAEPFDVVSILSEVEPGDGIFILKGNLESENLRVEADRTLQVRNVQIDVGGIKRLDHLRSSCSSFAATYRDRERERRAHADLARETPFCFTLHEQALNSCLQYLNKLSPPRETPRLPPVC